MIKLSGEATRKRTDGDGGIRTAAFSRTNTTRTTRNKSGTAIPEISGVNALTRTTPSVPMNGRPSETHSRTAAWFGVFVGVETQ
jgi:hypothetical protein